MRCRQCGHETITAFEFCEDCLALLPGRPFATIGAGSRDSFDFSEERALEALRHMAPPDAAARDTSRFPWNRPGHSVDAVLGRTRELRHGLERLREAIRTWGGRMLLVLGDHGVGTSSFIDAFRREGTRVAADLVWSQAACRDEPDQPHAVFGRLLRDRLQIPPQMDQWMAGESLLHAVEELFEEDERDDARDLAALVGFLVGFKLEGSPYLTPSEDDALTLVPRASQALTHLLCRFARTSPNVIVLDQAHRANAALLSLIDLIAQGIGGAPILLVVVGRPELKEAQPVWEAHDVIELGPMSKPDSETMLRLLLDGIEPVPRELVDRVVRKSGGSPQAIRTIVRYLHETGVITPVDRGRRWEIDETVFFDLDIPDTMAGVAQVRLQTLSPDERAVLQAAATMGQRAWFGALLMLQRLGAEQRVGSADAVGTDRGIVALERLLAGLVDREILQVAPDRSLPGEDTYTFASEIDREVLYESCPARTRHRIHRMVARWMELQSPAFVDANLAAIARHLERGGESSRAALVYQRAARRALESFDNPAAAELLEDALRLAAEEDTPLRINLHFALGRVHMLLGQSQRAIAVFREMLRLAWVMRSRAKGAVALSKIGQVLRSTGDYAAADQHLRTALQLFRAVHDDRGVAGALDDIGQVAWLTGDRERALLTFGKSRALRTELKDPRGLSLTLHYIGCVHLDAGEMEPAEQYLQDALALRRRLDDKGGMVLTLNNLGVVAWSRGDAPEAVRTWLESLASAREIGARPAMAMLMVNLAEAMVHSRRFDDAMSYAKDAAAIAERAGDRRTLASAHIELAYASLARGEHTAAIVAANAALDDARAIQNRRIEGLALVALGEVGIAASRVHGEAQGVQDGLDQMRAGADVLAEARCDVERAGALEQIAGALERLGQPGGDALEAEAAELHARHRSRPPRRPALPWEASPAVDGGGVAEAHGEVPASRPVDAPAGPAEPLVSGAVGETPGIETDSAGAAPAPTAVAPETASPETASPETASPAAAPVEAEVGGGPAAPTPAGRGKKGAGKARKGGKRR